MVPHIMARFNRSNGTTKQRDILGLASTSISSFQNSAHTGTRTREKIERRLKHVIRILKRDTE